MMGLILYAKLYPRLCLQASFLGRQLVLFERSFQDHIL